MIAPKRSPGELDDTIRWVRMNVQHPGPVDFCCPILMLCTVSMCIGFKWEQDQDEKPTMDDVCQFLKWAHNQITDVPAFLEAVWGEQL